MATTNIVECCAAKIVKLGNTIKLPVDKAAADRQCKESLDSMSRRANAGKITCMGIASDAEYELGLGGWV